MEFKRRGSISHERPTGTEAIEAGGIERAKATRIASVIFDAIHQNVATKAYLEARAASLRAEIQGGFARIAGSLAEAEGKITRQDVAIERLRSSLRELESRLTVRLGGIVAAAVAILVALRHLWPPH
jgi:hypothetical protein